MQSMKTSKSSKENCFVVGDSTRINVVTYLRFEYSFMVSKCCHRRTLDSMDLISGAASRISRSRVKRVALTVLEHHCDQ